LEFGKEGEISKRQSLHFDRDRLTVKTAFSKKLGFEKLGAIGGGALVGLCGAFASTLQSRAHEINGVSDR
jgi:hypothetical protein